jgi:hypothetical protein
MRLDLPLTVTFTHTARQSADPLPEKAGHPPYTEFNPNRTIKKRSKGKAVPLQAWSGPEVSRKLRFPDFMTTAQDDGKVVSLTHRPPLSQEIHLVLISVGG